MINVVSCICIQEAENGQEVESTAVPSALPLPIRPYPLKLPDPLETALSAGEQVFKPTSLLGQFI